VVTPTEVEIDLVAEGTKRDPRDASRAWSGTGRFQFADRAVAYRIGPVRFDSLDAARARLEELRKASSEQTVILRAGRGVVTGEVVAVLDELLGAGFTGVRFASR
jgi:hypothetical protein